MANLARRWRARTTVPDGRAHARAQHRELERATAYRPARPPRSRTTTSRPGSSSSPSATEHRCAGKPGRVRDADEPGPRASVSSRGAAHALRPCSAEGFVRGGHGPGLGGAGLAAAARASASSPRARICGRQERRVARPGLADGDGRHRDAAGHLDRGQQGVEPVGDPAGQGHADDRAHRARRHDTGEVGRHPGPAHEDLHAVPLGPRAPARRSAPACGAPRLTWASQLTAEPVQLGRGLPQQLPVVGGAHEDEHPRRLALTTRPCRCHVGTACPRTGPARPRA